MAATASHFISAGMPGLLALLVALLSLAPATVAAQCAATTTYDFATSPNNVNWTNTSATAGFTSFATSAFSSTGNLATFQTATFNGTQRLTWEADYTTVASSSTVTFTFSQPVTTLKILVVDIDRNQALGNGNDFQDAVTFDGYTAANTLIALTTANVANSRGLTQVGNTVTDTGILNNGGGTTTVTFPQPVKRLVLTYANTEVADTNPGNQAIGIGSLSWCSFPPVANNATTGTVPSTAMQAGISTLSGTADSGASIAGYTLTSLPANGMLFYNSGAAYVAVAAGQALTAAQAATLRYTPDATYTGASTTFTYTARDNGNQVSANTATYTIPLQYLASCATATNTLDFSAAYASGDWKNHAALSVPNGATITTVKTQTAAGASTYTSGATASSSLATGTLNSATLVWTNDYSAGSTKTSSVTFNFNRLVSNFTVQVQDVDASGNFIDRVIFSGSDGSGTVTPTLALANPSAGITTISGNTATGQANTASTVDGTVTAYFPAPVSSVTITYQNATTANDGDNQSIGIDQMTWCRIAPTANNVTTTAVPSAATQAGIANLSGTADGTGISSYTITSLPANGTLYYYNGTTNMAVANNQVLTAAQSTTLTYTPDPNYTGANTTFTYKATDDASIVSTNTATFTIPLQYIAPCATATNTLSFAAAYASGDWKNHAALSVPQGNTVTTVKTQNAAGTTTYTSGTTTASSLATGTLNSATLVWTNDYANNSTKTSAVTFNFNRAVSNFTVQVQDIDASGNFIDQVVFAGDNSGTAVTPTLTAANPNSGVVSVSGNTATGQANTTSTVDGTVTAFFASPITSLTITYRNATPATDGDNQSIGIDQMTWCRLAPTANNVTTAALPSNATQAGINSLSGTADGTGISAYTIATLPANGTLYYNNGTANVAVVANQTITAAQAATLTYTADPNYTGNSTTFTYKALDDQSVASTNTATYTIPLLYSTPCVTAPVTLDYSVRTTGEDWKTHTEVGVPNPAGLTTIKTVNGAGTSTYTSGATTASTLAIGTANSPSLLWDNDYANGSSKTSSVTFNFNRALSNFSVRIQDIDASGNFIDRVIFAGANGGTSVTPTLVLANPGAGVTTVSGNTATGQANTGSTVDGTVTAYFPSPITSLTLTYQNATPAADGDNQLIGIDQMTWCRLAPTATNVTNTTRPSGQGATATNSLIGAADGTVASYTISNLDATQGTYYVNGVALNTSNFPGLVLTPTQATQLSFAPAAGFSGTASFSCVTNDDAGLASSPATYTTPVTLTGGAGTPAPCATPGKDGSPTLATNPDTYYPSRTATQTLGVGATSIDLGVGVVGGAPGIATSIVKGDLLLVIQMQGADINYSNSDSYGDGVSGGGASGNLTSGFTAGTYEYVMASNVTAITAAAGGTITLATGLKNTYMNAAATTTTSQRRFQVVRVPQFGNLTLGGTLVPTPWNGSTGGVLAIDVAGQTNFSGNTIDASARGFRGGGGRTQATAVANTQADYVDAVATVNANGQKGEGTAGTPRYVNVPTTPGDATTNATTDLAAEGYPGGTSGRGAPGNAGGGGGDNINNSGGGGGANGGTGGRGGNSFADNQPIGGEPGTSFGVVASTRLVLGGGGGAGSTNNATGTPANGFASSGAAGGGLVLLRTGTVSGTGSIVANGGSGNTSVLADGGGGGGAGGTILVTANTPAGLTGLTLTANGGTGGSNTGSTNNDGPHGPGGGGAGGVVLVNSSVSSASAVGGANGTTRSGGTNYTLVAFNSAPGTAGVVNTQISNNIANSTVGTTCATDVTTALTGPSTLTPAQPSGTYTATFTNEGPQTALNVTRTVTLPSGVTNIMVNGVSYTPTTANTIDFGTAASLASGASTSFTFSFTPATTATGTLVVTSSTTTTSGQGNDQAPNTSTITATVPPVADVAATITAGPSVAAGTLASAGSPPKFTVNFTNNGPASAAGVVASVQLPAGLTNVAITNAATTGATYNATTGLVTFPNLTSLNNAGSSSAVITFDAPTNGPVMATANISTTTSEAGQTANDTASAGLPITPTFDLTTSLSGPTTGVAGDLVMLAITTSNSGPSAVPTVVQRAQLPAGLTNVYVSNGGFYNPAATSTTITYGGTVYTVPAGGVIYPPIASLPSGQTVANTVSFSMPATPTTGFAPTATVSTVTSGETNTANNTVNLNGAATGTPAATLAPTPALGNPANVYTRLSASTATTTVGSPVTLTVTTGNNGSATSAGGSATNVVQTVQLLPGFTAATIQSDGQAGTLNAATNTITFPNGATYNTLTGMLTFQAIAAQASGASVSHTITFTAPASTGNNGQLVATAAVTMANADPVPADNVASTAIALAPTTDLATSITGPASVMAGQSVTYTATFVNNGSMAASGYNVSGTQTSGVFETAQLPVGLSGVTITDPAGVIVSGASYNATTGLVTFPTLTTDAVGATQTYNLNFVAPAANLVVRSSVSTASADGNATNNNASATTTVTPAADLTTTVAGPATAPLGNPVNYTVTTTNNGPSTATTVVPTLQLVAGFDVTNIQVAGQAGTLSGNVINFPNGATYNTTSGLITLATTASLSTGASIINRVTVLMPNATGGQLTATSSVTSATADLALGNNGSSVATSIAPATTTMADLVATVTPSTASATSVAAGSPFTFTATFANGGPDAATNVVPTLQLPVGLTGVTVSNGGVYNPITGLVTWPVVASLASGTANNLVYTATLTAPATSPLVAVAIVSSDTSEPNNATALSNNTNRASVTVTPVFDEVTRISGPAAALPGTSQTYTVTTLNNGPSPSANATTQTVTLPAGVAPVAGSYGTGTYSSAANTITWTIPAGQAAGTAGAVTNSFAIAQQAAGMTLTANVTVTGDSNPGNNSYPITTTVPNQPPTAAAVINALQSPEGSTAANNAAAPYGTLISPLVGSDPENALSASTPYTIVSVPTTAQGVLYYNTTGTTYAAVPAGQTLTAAQAASLRFLPALGYTGNAAFTYLATDAAGNQSAVANYTVPVGLDNISAYKTSTQVRGGIAANAYQNNDVLTYVADPNGAQYNAAGLVYDAATGVQQSGTNNGIASATLTSGTLPPGTALNPTTGQVYVIDRNALPKRASSTTFTITTVDIYGGINTVTQTIVLGDYPLPVVLTKFEAQAVQNRDALLTWSTASETNSAYFDVERSLDGTSFVKIGQRSAQGNKLTNTDYSLTNAGIGAKVAAGQPVYYRLRQVDLDGTASYSPVRTVSFTGQAVAAITLFPNPAASATTLDLSQLPATGTYQVQLLDAVGRTVLQASLPGGQMQPLDLSGLAIGTYQVLVTGQQASGSALRQMLRLTKE